MSILFFQVIYFIHTFFFFITSSGSPVESTERSAACSGGSAVATWGNSCGLVVRGPIPRVALGVAHGVALEVALAVAPVNCQLLAQSELQ